MWSPSGFGDFSGNANETDMLMRNSNTGMFELYDINNNTIAPVTTQFGQVGLEWSISGISAHERRYVGYGVADRSAGRRAVGRRRFVGDAQSRIGCQRG